MKNDIKEIIQTITKELEEYGGFYTDHEVHVYNDEFIDHNCYTTLNYQDKHGDFIPFLKIYYDIVTLDDSYDFHNSNDVNNFTNFYQDYVSADGEYELDNIDSNIDIIVKADSSKESCRHYVLIRSVGLKLGNEDQESDVIRTLYSDSNDTFLKSMFTCVLDPSNISYFVESIIPNYNNYKIVYQPISELEENILVAYGFKKLNDNLYSIDVDGD